MQKKKRWGKASSSQQPQDVPGSSQTAALFERETRLQVSLTVRARELFSPAHVLNSSTKKDLALTLGTTQVQSFTPKLLRDIELVDKCVAYIPAFFPERTWYAKLYEELGPWEMSPYKRSRHPACVTQEKLAQSAAYLAIVERLRKRFPSLVIGYSIVNLYRDENDWTEMHRDNFSGEGNRFVGSPFTPPGAGPQAHNVTIGASFGDERELVFCHLNSQTEFSFPQREGDIFAFTAPVNTAFQHSIPKGNAPRSGRISVILWGHVVSNEL